MVEMVGVQTGGTLAGLLIDADLDMGAFNITLGASQTVDGKDVGTLGAAGARATLLHWQREPASGSIGTPERINNNDPVTAAVADVLNEYSQVLFSGIVRVDQYRHYGHATNNGTGRWKLQKLDPTTNTWIDIVTGIVISQVVGWSAQISFTECLVTGIRLVCTTVDTNGSGSIVGEFEVTHSEG